MLNLNLLGLWVIRVVLCIGMMVGALTGQLWAFLVLGVLFSVFITLIDVDKL